MCTSITHTYIQHIDIQPIEIGYVFRVKKKKKTQYLLYFNPLTVNRGCAFVWIFDVNRVEFVQQWYDT